MTRQGMALMQLQGRIQDWNDQRGFGFVTPNGGGDKAFVHIKAWQGSGRPHDGLLVRYRTSSDRGGRLNAVAVKPARAGARPRTTSRRGAGAGSQRWRVVTGGLVLGMLAGACALMLGPWLLWAGLLATSLVTALAYALDKSAARRGRRRTPEATLHLFGLAGGWPGALLAQGLLRHKTAKDRFQAVFWVSVIGNLIALAALWLGGGRLLAVLAGG